MDASTFDHLARTLFTRGSRRTALGAVMAAGAALGLAGTDGATAQLACNLKANGQRCQSDSECCSGRCRRGRRERYGTCRQAGGQGICTVEQNACTGGFAGAVCGTGAVGLGGNCFCNVTTRGRSFCSGTVVRCGNCTSSRQCEQEFGEGAKCISMGTGTFCSGCSTACALPCPQPA